MIRTTYWGIGQRMSDKVRRISLALEELSEDAKGPNLDDFRNVDPRNRLHHSSSVEFKQTGSATTAEEAYRIDRGTGVGKDRKNDNTSSFHPPPTLPKLNVLPNVSDAPLRRVFDPFRVVVDSTVRDSWPDLVVSDEESRDGKTHE